VSLEDNPVGDVLPSFTVHGLRGGLTVFRRGGHTHRVGVAVENLTDELYAESSNVSFFRPEPARNVTLTYQVSF
jgi:outer membrane receptor protein involved in Fe transport